MWLANANIIDGYEFSRTDKQKWDTKSAFSWRLYGPGFDVRLNTTQVQLWISGAMAAYRTMEGAIR